MRRIGTTFLLATLLSGAVTIVAGQDSQAADDAPDQAKVAAEQYRRLFEQAADLEEQLGASYEALIFPEDPDVPTPSEAGRELFDQQVETIVTQAAAPGSAPQVDWGLRERLETNGLATRIDHVSGARRITQLTSAYAKRKFPSNPDDALRALSIGLNMARHVNQEPTLISHLTLIACESIIFPRAAELAPLMTNGQLAQLRKVIDSAPTTGTLAEAMRTEQSVMVGHFRRRLDRAWDEWRKTNRSTGFRFPEDLRLAGITQLPGKPMRISLHFVPTSEEIWLNEGTAHHGVLLQEVSPAKHQALLRYRGETAILDLKRGTIEARSVPWPVIESAFGGSKFLFSDTTREQFETLGLGPENILDTFDQLDAFYEELIARLDGPLPELKQWEDEVLDAIDDESFASLVLPSLHKIAEVEQQRQLREQSLQLGLSKIQQGFKPLPTTEVVEFEGERFLIDSTKKGFSITPEQFDTADTREASRLHFGSQ